MPLSSGISIYVEPDPANRTYGPLGATQVFIEGEPVQYSGNLLVAAAVADLAALLDGNFAGIAVQAATGTQAASRTGLTFGGGPGGNQTGTARAFIPATATGVRYATRNYWNDPTAAPPTRTAITGALTGTTHPLAVAYDATLPNGRAWGLDDGAFTAGTHAGGFITAVLDANGVPVTGATAGTTLLFQIVQTSNQLVGS